MTHGLVWLKQPIGTCGRYLFFTNECVVPSLLVKIISIENTSCRVRSSEL